MAAEFPERPITIVVPYGAGGAGDTIIRLLSPTIERKLGQPLIIESRPGGGGINGWENLGSRPAEEPPQKFLEDTKAEAQVWSETVSRGKLAVE
jgi:tripartite-type tricarboxylate transporter receptor subunit TctC